LFGFIEATKTEMLNCFAIASRKNPTLSIATSQGVSSDYVNLDYGTVARVVEEAMGLSSVEMGLSYEFSSNKQTEHYGYIEYGLLVLYSYSGIHGNIELYPRALWPKMSACL
jgi:hypothetical protein